MERLFKIRGSQCWKIMSPAKKEGELSVTCMTYLKEWYANDNEEVHSKYMDKGNIVEHESLDFIANQFGLGILEKNQEQKENDFCTGSIDTEGPEYIIDNKAAWSQKTLNDNIDGPNEEYLWQGRVYMWLWNKDQFVVMHTLLDTPEEANYGREVIYQDRPVEQRFIGYGIKRDPAYEDAITMKVLQCRKWLEQYDKKVKSMLGKIHWIN